MNIKNDSISMQHKMAGFSIEEIIKLNSINGNSITEVS